MKRAFDELDEAEAFFIEDTDKSPISDAVILAVGVCLTACFLIVIGAFIYKVWNERQMTHEYRDQAVELRRIADAVERTRLPSPSLLRIH